MKVLFYLGHPAHFHLFKNVIKTLKSQGHTVFILIKKKDILEQLLIDEGLEYLNILPKGRKDSKIGIATGLIKRDIKLLGFCLKHKPDIMAGTSPEICHIGKLLNIPSININEDDFDVVPLYSKLSYPFATCILTPIVCKTGKWEYKTVKYEGYHELAYLHPNNFTPDKNKILKYFDLDSPYFIIRFAKLNAHHDKGISGIDNQIALNIIDILKNKGRIYITSEREIDNELEKYRLPINPLDIHHVMYYANLYIGDSQTMAAEAGVLGTPFIRFNDFVGRIGYLDELENKYQLGFGIKPSQVDLLYSQINKLLEIDNIKTVWEARKNKMLSEKIDVAAFIAWFINNFPKSIDMDFNNEIIKFQSCPK